jgi:sugar phosphate isomerase/epimerase
VDPVISINTIAYEGYDLTTALQEIAKIGARHVEIGYTRGFTEGLTESHFSEAAAIKINRLLSDLGLSSFALSAHIDLTTEDAVDELKRRIDFGKRLGAKIVNTKVGARSGRKKAEENIEPLADYAESMNIVIGLENPAEGTDQIITSGKTGAEVVKRIDSDFIKLNYDFGNAFTYSKGEVDPAFDYKEALPYACHLHLKDMNKLDDGWVFAQIGQGIVNYDLILRELVEDKKNLPLSIEHLFIYTATKNLIVKRKAKAPELEHIRMSLKASYDYVKSFFRTRILVEDSGSK